MSPRLTQQRLLAQCPRRAIALASGHSVERLRNRLDMAPTTFDRFVRPRTLAAWLDNLDGVTACSAGRVGPGVGLVPVRGLRLPPARVWRRPFEVGV